MIEALQIAATGMQAQQRQVETISNNMANMATPGFKRSKVSFVDLVSRGAEPQPGTDTVAVAGSRGLGVSVGGVSLVMDAGDVRRSDDPADLMIAGAGYLEVLLPDGGTAFSRGGHLRIGADGQLTTAEGYPLKAALTLPTGAKDFIVASDGTVAARDAQGRDQVVGQMTLVRFNDEDGLETLGDRLYRATARSGDPISGRAAEQGFGIFRQGFQEASNVKLGDEVVGLMLAQRAYEANAKVLQASDEMLAMVNNLRK